MLVPKLKHFLDENHVKYVVIQHSPAFSAQQIAARSHISGKEMAKSVMIKMDGKMAMAVLPASELVDLKKLRRLTGSHTVELASEEEFKYLFPDCETGAMPPFGNLYGMEVFVAGKLTEDQEIAFNAGSHSELVKLEYKDFENLVHPKIMKFAMA